MDVRELECETANPRGMSVLKSASSALESRGQVEGLGAGKVWEERKAYPVRVSEVMTAEELGTVSQSLPSVQLEELNARRILVACVECMVV